MMALWRWWRWWLNPAMMQQAMAQMVVRKVATLRRYFTLWVW
jgi:hypothetical protein